jgi:hypothetical protein
MIRMTQQSPVVVYRVLDREGRPIGQVVQPTSVPTLGLGARTVLLVRGKEETVLPLTRI